MKFVGSKQRLSKDIVPILQNIIDAYKPEAYIEPFCLSHDTNIYTEDGIVKIKDIKVGDYIYDNNLTLKRVKRKIKSPISNGVKITTTGNVCIVATKNHLFYSDKDNSETKASDIKEGFVLKTGKDSGKKLKYIDMSDFITTSNKKGGRSGCIIDESKIKLYHNAPIMNRYLKINKELMWCYGITVAEGDKGNITLHKDELETIGHRFIKNYSNAIGVNFKNQKIYTIRNNSVQVSVPLKTIYEKIFFRALGVGYGARNKNISFLFKVDRNMAREALRGMFMGDGCIRQKGKYRSLNYKTSSRTLAYQLQTLLSVKFDIKSTLSYGINKQRTIEGRVIDESDYYNISINRDCDINKIIEEKNNNEIRKEKSSGFTVKSIEDIEKCDFYDITLEDNSTHKFILDGGIVTHNCGGANVIDKIEYHNKKGYDNNKYLIAMWQALQSGWKIPDRPTREEYWEVKENKDNFPPEWVAIVGFVSTYNAKWFDGYANITTTKTGVVRDYYDEGKRNIEKQVPDIMDIKFECSDYSNIEAVNSVIYCDPPYQTRKTRKDLYGHYFNHKEYFDWAREKSKNNIVICSEYNMPDDFVSIYEKGLELHFDNRQTDKRVERLFVHKSNLEVVKELLMKGE